MKPAGDKLTFFRQSGWMVVATVAGGVFMTAVHVVVSKPMLKTEYALFYALLRVFLLLGFPAGGLQVVFAQQTAAALSADEQKKLSQTTRAVLRGTFLIWLGMAAAVFIWRTPISVLLKITNPAALWVTVLLGLAALWLPVLKGILQGRQNFAGLGWVLILDGIGRFTAIVLIVQLGGQAAGGMTGALIGQLVSLGLGAWLVREVLRGPGAPFEWRPWFKKVLPLTFGVGVFLFMCSADVIYVQALFSKEETPLYIPGAMIALALVTFTTPLAAVMFPKIVQSAARTEKSDALRQALATTALLGGAAALACTIFPQLPLRIIFLRNPDYWKSAPLVPWFAWALLPLILANVLLNNLLARGRFRVVPWSVVVGAGYALALLLLADRISLFSAWDLRDSQALARRWAEHSTPLTAYLWQQTSPEGRDRLSQGNLTPAQLKQTLLEELNRAVHDPTLYDPQRFAGISLSEATQNLIEDHPTGRGLTKLNRVLLQQAFAADLAPPADLMFTRFKLIIGTLGVFSSLLLVVAMWCTFRNSAAPVGVLARETVA